MSDPQSLRSLLLGTRAASPRKNLICSVENALRAFSTLQIKSGERRRREQAIVTGIRQTLTSLFIIYDKAEIISLWQITVWRGLKKKRYIQEVIFVSFYSGRNNMAHSLLKRYLTSGKWGGRPKGPRTTPHHSRPYGTFTHKDGEPLNYLESCKVFASLYPQVARGIDIGPETT